VLDIFREELLLEAGSKKPANHQEYQTGKQNDPAMCDRLSDKSVVKAEEATLALLFDREFFLLGRSLDVVAQKWNERHGNKERAQQPS
jgi:hypothetical protein